MEFDKLDKNLKQQLIVFGVVASILIVSVIVFLGQDEEKGRIRFLKKLHLSRIKATNDRQLRTTTRLMHKWSSEYSSKKFDRDDLDLSGSSK